MPDEISNAQTAPETTTEPFAVFYPSNTAATHLLEIVQLKQSPPNLRDYGNTIGYWLSPSSPTGHGFEDIWHIGAGPPTKIVEKIADHFKPAILLGPPDSSPSAAAARRSIFSRHATIYFHETSGVPMLKTTCRRPVVYEDDDVSKDLVLSLRDQKTCVLWKKKNVLRFGDYRFILEFTSQGQENMEVVLAGFPGLHPSLAFDSAPTANSEMSGTIRLHNKIPDTSVTSGIDIYTGEPMAVKQLPKNEALSPYTQSRLQFACQYKEKRDQGVLWIMDVWCKCDMSPPCSSDECEGILYSMPLAKYNFRDRLWAKVNFEERLALFHQTLLGLAELHSQNMTSGMILPESLLILPELKDQIPSERAFISLNMQERKKKPNRSVYVAPEVWENRHEQILDETKLDIWALALSWICVFITPPERMKIRRETYVSLQKTIDSLFEDGEIDEPFANLLRRMVAWAPHARPSAADALADEVWKHNDQKQEAEDSRKRSKTETIQDDGVEKGTKRVRVVSPGPGE
ncbi:hypothetical protein V8C35DRAFT_231786 [Trichoderma chlorosporum]